MLNLRFLTTLMLAFLTSVSSSGQSSLPLTLIDEAFVKRHAAAYANEIIQACKCDSIDDVKLSEVLKGIEQAKWKMVSAQELPVSANDGLRAWAVYDPSDRTIKFNENVMRAQLIHKTRAMALNSITLHESLRSMGLSKFDENYELTTALSYVAATGDSQTAKDVLKPLKGLKNGLLSKARGGSTSTGGGGNDIAVVVKMMLLTMVDNTEAWAQIAADHTSLQRLSKIDRFNLAVNIRLETDPHRLDNKVLVKQQGQQRTYILPEAPFHKALPNDDFNAVISQLITLIAEEYK